MATLKVRYFVRKPGRGAARYFWQPAPPLRKAGWTPERLPDDLAAALARATALNAQLDAWRLTGAAGPGTASPDGPRPRDGRRGPPAKAKTLNSLAHVIALYKASPRYTARKASTRAGYDWLLAQLEAWGGAMQMASIDRPRVQLYYERLRMAGRPAKANALLRMLRIVGQFAVDKGIVRANPAEKPGLIGTPPRLRIWTPDELAALVAAADALGVPSIGDATVLAYYLGQRQGDVLALTRLQYVACDPGLAAAGQPGSPGKSARVKLQQRKTQARIDVPVPPACPPRVAAAIARLDAAGSTAPTLVVCEATGRPWTSDFFRHEFARVRAAAAAGYARADGARVRAVPSIADAWFLDLRDTAVTRLAEAGCTVPELCAITGHSEAGAHQILKHYLALTGTMADNAIAKLLAHEAAQAAAGEQKGEPQRHRDTEEG